MSGGVPYVLSSTDSAWDAMTLASSKWHEKQEWKAKICTQVLRGEFRPTKTELTMLVVRTAAVITRGVPKFDRLRRQKLSQTLPKNPLLDGEQIEKK